MKCLWNHRRPVKKFLKQTNKQTKAPSKQKTNPDKLNDIQWTSHVRAWPGFTGTEE
jgi:hypothetical protein